VAAGLGEVWPLAEAVASVLAYGHASGVDTLAGFLLLKEIGASSCGRA
jgi:hypothetical protein